MLRELQLHNFILAEELTISFAKGLTVLSGETGAGKSIILDAIGLLLGGRGGAQFIRAGKERATIQGWFEVAGNTPIETWLENQSIDVDAGDCIITRVIYRDGKSKAQINGVALTITQLRDFSMRLVEIHGQNQQLAFCDQSFQRSFIDRYAGLTQSVSEFAHEFDDWRLAKQAYLNAKKRLEELLERESFIDHQIQELNSHGLSGNEWNELNQKHTALVNQSSKKSLQATVQACITEDDTSILNQLHALEAQLKSEQALDENLESIIIQIRSLLNDLTSAFDGSDVFSDGDGEPESLESLEHRMSIIHTLARKHKVAPHELRTVLDAYTTEKQELQDLSESVKNYEETNELLYKALWGKATQLSEARQNAALELAAASEKYFPSLGLASASISIEVTQTEKNLHRYGLDTIAMLVQFNQGYSMKPLHQIASGGELSRVALSLYLGSVAVKSDALRSLVFDEIDAGIGGATARALGSLLSELAVQHQVIVVTHHATIAACGASHYVITKNDSNHETMVSAKIVDGDSRIQELSRMLSGDSDREASLQHAKELLDRKK